MSSILWVLDFSKDIEAVPLASPDALPVPDPSPSANPDPLADPIPFADANPVAGPTPIANPKAEPEPFFGLGLGALSG